MAMVLLAANLCDLLGDDPAAEAIDPLCTTRRRRTHMTNQPEQHLFISTC